MTLPAQIPSPVSSGTSATYFAPPDENRASRGRRTLAIVAVVGVHLLALIAIVHAALRPEPPLPVQALAVRMVELPPPAPPRIEAPKPVPPKAPPKRVRTPPPVLAAAPSVPLAPTVFAVPPQPEPVVAAPAPVATPAPVAAAAPIVDARFDADYLQNPPPVYPATSRRQHEEGRVVLRVRVSRDGRPLSVEVRQSSGFSRLDEAAKSAVERWRFVPASQGGEPVESSVLVPLNFTLSN